MSKRQVLKDISSGVTELADTDIRIRLADAVFETASEGIIISNSQNRIVQVNPAFSSITGYSSEEAIGKNPGFLKSGRHDDEFYNSIRKSLARSGKWQGEIWNRRKNGEVYLQWQSLTALEAEDGSVEAYVGTFYDAGKFKRMDDKEDFYTNYDALTGLPNRNLLQDRILQAQKNALATRERVGILYLDLDHFKSVNDEFNHNVGDSVLVEMSQRLKDCLRDCDIIGRLSGDKFLVVLPKIRSDDETTIILNRLLIEAARPINVDGCDTEILITVSIGVAVFPDDGETVEDIIRNADTASFHAKREGRNNYQYFTEDMNIRARKRIRMEKGLRRALENEELEIYYQPKVELRRGKIVGMEALLRWRIPETGELLSPAKFIPLAEETGLIVPIGEWVLGTACTQLKSWLDGGMRPLQMSVNLSMRQLTKKSLLNDITKILDSTGLAPRMLEMEITETSLMENTDDVIAVLKDIRGLGIQLSVDDFGTGYSSLNYLRNFPIDVIKIDQSFVVDIGGDGGGAMLAAAVIAIGQSLGLKVIAEGVENETQLAFLRQQWCDEIQGFYFSRPVPAEDFAAMVANDKSL